MASLKSPRPNPQFFYEAQSFSTKKARATPREELPPRPPVKSAPPISRVFQTRPVVQKAQAVSFRVSDSSLLSKHYNENSKDLYFDQCFEVECKLGAGSFGEVFKVRSKEDGRCYAVKRSRERFRGESDRQRKLEEVQKHEQLPKNPNCVGFIKAWEERQHLYIQTELCDMSLCHYAEKNHDIPESVIWNYLVDLLLALKHLHDHNLIHLDIKPANIFITSDGICKLGDFGLVLDMKKGDLSEAQEGDPKYLAPELMEGKFTMAADVFSLGITILELACDLDLPRGGDAWHQLREGEFPGEFFDSLSSDLRHIIKWMMHPDCRQRPTVNQILAVPSVQKVVRRRKLQTAIRIAVSTVPAVFSFLWSWLATLCIVVFSPAWTFVHRSRQYVTPPRKNCRHPSEWDQSFSDDEVFEDDVINSSSSSLGAPLADTSTSSDSRNGSFSLPSASTKMVISTPALSKSRRSSKRLIRSVVTLDWDSCRLSPELCPRPSFHSNSSSPSLDASRISNTSLLDNGDDVISPNIGPKNLMNIFEAASSEDSS